jgi:general secretion pathway protein D
MKSFISFVALLMSLSLGPIVFAAEVTGRSQVAAASFDFDSIALSDLVRLVYLQAYPTVPYVLDPKVLQDTRLVSFRWTASNGDARNFLRTYLRSLGYSMSTGPNNVDLIAPLPPAAHLSVVQDPDIELFIYKPKYRNASYLIETLSPLFSGQFTGQRKLNLDAPGDAQVGTQSVKSSGLVVPGSLLDQTNRKDDQVIFAGQPKEVAALRKLLPQLDIAVGQVMVNAALYEVQSSEHDGSAVQLAASLLSGKFQFNLGAAQAADNFVSFKTGSVSLLMQALSTDSRFKVLSSPSLRVRSGESASLTVGQDVPVLGAITYPQGGSSPVQSVETRSSGVLFSIFPEVRDSSISVKVDQQVSNFVLTTTGVNNSPTLNKRQLSTSVDVTDSEVVVIGGLREDKEVAATGGLAFLPRWMKSQSGDKTHSEILLFLQVTRL